MEPDDSRQETVRDQFKAELRTLSSLGLPYVGFLLQHEYTQRGAVKEVDARATWQNNTEPLPHSSCVLRTHASLTSSERSEMYRYA